jgi:hypothetical protein
MEKLTLIGTAGSTPNSLSNKTPPPTTMLRLLHTLVFIVLGSCEGFAPALHARNSRNAAPLRMSGMIDDVKSKHRNDVKQMVNAGASLGDAMKQVSAFFDNLTNTGPTIEEIEEFCRDPDSTGCDVEMIEKLMAEAEKMKSLKQDKGSDPIYWSAGAPFRFRCTAAVSNVTKSVSSLSALCRMLLSRAQILTRP